MNLFEQPAWAESLLGNKVKFPSFGTASPQPAVPAHVKDIMKRQQSGELLKQMHENETIANEIAAVRKKPGPKPGSKRKVKE